MAKAKRKRKLKVYRTPIGFHDAYVAAPSQKAALEAWGAETNLFAGGAAEQVTGPELTKVPLEHPGQVVKVLRGTRAEQLAALDEIAASRPRDSRPAKSEIVARKPGKRPVKPSRARLEKAEKAASDLERRHKKQLAAIEQQVRELDRKRRELERRHERERDEAQERLEDEQAEYETAIRRYESG